MNWDKVKAVTIAVFTAIGNFFKSVWSENRYQSF